MTSSPMLQRLRRELGEAFTLTELIAAVERLRGRALIIKEMPELNNAGGALCGLWIDRPGQDIILHASSTSELHRQQFILHELAHIILDHAKTEDIGRAAAAILPDLPRGAVIHALGRDMFHDDREIEAEQLADRLAAALRHARRARSELTDIFA